MPLAVIFDVDGVLVDSYRAHLQSWLDEAGGRDLDLTEEQFAATFGRTSREIIRARWGRSLGEAGVEAMARAKEARYRRIITEDFPAMPGAAALLERLGAAGFRLAVGSSGPPDNVELVLERLGVRPLVGAVVTGADVTRGKPDPEVFLLAAGRLGVEPARCAVVEDAPAGIQAARAGGMSAVAMLSTGRRESDFADAAADLVVRSLAELSPELLLRLIMRRVPA